MITTIIFDLSEVYLTGLVGTYSHVQEKLKDNIVDQNFFIPELNLLFHGKIAEKMYWQKVITKNSWNITVAELMQAVRKNFKEIEGTRKIIEKLRKKGYKMVLLSNHAKEWVEFCEKKFGYHKLFHVTLYSYEVALLKPDKKLFKMIIKKLNVKPQECLFIDDNKKNIISAKELQMRAIQFESAKKLRGDLLKKGF